MISLSTSPWTPLVLLPYRTWKRGPRVVGKSRDKGMDDKEKGAAEAEHTVLDTRRMTPIYEPGRIYIFFSTLVFPPRVSL